MASAPPVVTSGRATVKAVPTGDTVVLIGNATNGPPPELQLSLSDCSAPRLSRGPGTAEEPNAWEAREFLRKLVLGKPVIFRKERSAGPSNRAFGSLWFVSESGGPGESIAVACLKAGWCGLNNNNRKGGDAAAASDTEVTQLAEQEARDAKRGIHSPTAAQSVREVKWSGVDVAALVEGYDGKLANGIVEYVSNGSNMRVLLMPEMVMVNMGLAGVRCGRVGRPSQPAKVEGEAATPAEPGEPFAAEAKHFVETRLLHRQIFLKLVGVDKSGNAVLGTVVHSAGNISVELLKAGLAKCVEPATSTLCGTQAPLMRAAELGAKSNRTRLWASYVRPQVSGVIAGVDGTEAFDVTVVEVLSGDQLSVSKVDKPEDEFRISLAGIRAPRLGNARQQRAGEPWADESKEMLRKCVIGAKCRVKVDYVRDLAPRDQQTAGSSTTEEKQPVAAAQMMRAFATVSLCPPKHGVSDVAEKLVAEGLAVSNAPRSSEERASRFDELLAAERAAKAKKLRIHSDGGQAAAKKDSVVRVVDLTGDVRKAKAFLPSLQRARALKGTVEAVFSGSRVKLRVPVSSTEHCSLMLGLSAVRSPAPSSAARPNAEPGGEAAKSWLRRRVLQRTVEVTVEDMDRNGVGLGSFKLSEADNGKAKCFEVEGELLKLGLARLDSRHAGRGGWASLEDAAREAHVGLWADAANRAEHEAKSNAALAYAGGSVAVVAAAEEKSYKGCISEIVDGTKFFLQDDPGRLEAANKHMASFAPGGAAAMAMKKNALCATQFDDGSGKAWCRVKIVEINKASQTCLIRYIDFGNEESGVSPDRLRGPLVGPMAALAPAAAECELAYVHAAGALDDDGEAAAQRLHELAWGVELAVSDHTGKAQQPGPRRVVLRVNGSSCSLNETLVEEGLARTKKTAAGEAKACTQGPALVAKLRELEGNARKSRVGVWRYGDVDFSDDER